MDEDLILAKMKEMKDGIPFGADCLPPDNHFLGYKISGFIGNPNKISPGR